MAVNENIIKNMANEVTREALMHNVPVDPQFAIYLVELLLLNPKYGKLFTKTMKRKNLEFFVNEVVDMLVRGDISINVMKMQFIMSTQYDRLNALIDNHLRDIDHHLKPLLNEILDATPDVEEDEEDDEEEHIKKLYRKISIYIILATGLGDPKNVQVLRENLGALESVFSLDELRDFMDLTRSEKKHRIRQLAEIVAGVRLYNRDCFRGAEGIVDLSSVLVESGKSCLMTLSDTMMSIVKSVYQLTELVEHAATVDPETGNVGINVRPGFQRSDYERVFDLLALNRQYEIFMRTLLMDAETLVTSSIRATEASAKVYKEIHEVVEYRTGVPVAIIFPLFKKVFEAHREMQNIMYLVSTISKISSKLEEAYDEIKSLSQEETTDMTATPSLTNLPQECTEARMSCNASQMIMRNFLCTPEAVGKEAYLNMLGFCSLCLVVGALVPSSPRAGVVHARGMRFGFCTMQMNERFAQDPERYINEILEYIRNHPHLIRLLKVYSDVEAVREVDRLTVTHKRKVKTAEASQQTEHPTEPHIVRDYSWNLWDWKRRACQWASIVNCKTHSCQTTLSHHRAEIKCQTVEPRDKSFQTKKDTAMNTLRKNYYLWGLRGQLGRGQHIMDLTETHTGKKLRPILYESCSWPIIYPDQTEDQQDPDPMIDDTTTSCTVQYHNQF